MILDIHIPAGWHDRLGAEETDRLLVDDRGRWGIYEPGADSIVKAVLTAEEIEALRVTADDVMAHAPQLGNRSCRAGVDSWTSYGITRPDFLRWTASGIFEPAIAAELRGASIDPDRDSARLIMFAAALCDGDLSVVDFIKAGKQREIDAR